MNRLAGKVAIVTGGATGIGAEIARLYAEEGARVVIGDIRSEDAEDTLASIHAIGGDAIFVRTDVTRSEDVQALVVACEEHYGRLDVMTANAGILGHMGVPLTEISDEDFERVVSVNLLGVVRCFKYAIPAIGRAGTGSMAATASLAAHRGVARLDPYSASKAAVVGLVRSLAADLAPRIRVNAVSPGRVETDIARHAEEDAGIALSIPPRDPHSRVVPAVDARQVAWAFVFLASSEAASITGQTLRVDGGRSIFDG